MKLIQRVKVSGLRSILEANLASTGHLTSLAGKNSSGKSNFLRALNMFFNNEVEAGKPPVFIRDHRVQPKSKKKKRIEVQVTFSVPSRFKFRPDLRALEAGTNLTFEISRKWELDEQRKVVDALEFIVDENPVEGGPELARQFINLVHFRYIPNRAVPANVLREEADSIAKFITMRMKRGPGAEELLESFQRAAATSLRTASEAFEHSGAPISDLSVSAPESLAEMLQIFGFQAVSGHGTAVSDTEWGAGHQAYLLYEILKAVDTDYGQFFGWRQANIWGVEEPESGLHRDLEVQLATRFREWSHDEDLKLQILQTTHSPVFAMASDVGLWVEIDSGATTAEVMAVPKLVRAAEERGVSHWVQPILAYPWNPVVLVEGPRDVRALEHVAGILGFGDLRFFALPDLDPAQRGGGRDQIVRWLRQNGGLIAHRPEMCPLIVLLDWETSDQDLESARAAYGGGGERLVLRMNSKYCDPGLSRDFHGIERFYPIGIVEEAANAGEFQIGRSSGEPLSISKSQLERAKGPLLRRLTEVKTPEELVTLERILREVRAATAGHPLQLELYEGPQ